MKMTTNQIYVKFLFFISLYFYCQESAFCHTPEGNFMGRLISLFSGNNNFIKHESHENNRPIKSDKSTNSIIFNVMEYGAKGDGITNDAKAFKATLDAACKSKEGVVLIPSGYTFLLQQIDFDGNNCHPNIVVQMDGKIVGPKKQDWVGSNDIGCWIVFNGFNQGLIIKGNGIIDGRGASWWESNDSAFRPHAVGVVKSSDVRVTGITIQNSPRMHIFIADGKNLTIYNFTVSSPGDSPNTDGIHLSNIQHVIISNTTLASGDDCVSIQKGCSDVKIHDVNCGPGHGFSIGGLGPNKEEAHVSDVSVCNSNVHDALNGVRIKTWPSGSGLVRDVSFSNIAMSNVKIPVVIDQYYCGGPKNCPIRDKNAVAVSNVTYTSIYGTYTNIPVSLACSEFTPCTQLKFDDINILPTSNNPAKPYCLHAYGELHKNVTPSLKDCLLQSQSPTPEPMQSTAFGLELEG